MATPLVLSWHDSATHLLKHAEIHMNRVLAYFPTGKVPKTIKSSFGEETVEFKVALDGTNEERILATLEFKHCLEDIRSALDHAAYHLYDSFSRPNPPPKKTPRVYFPVSESTTTVQDFAKDFVPGPKGRAWFNAPPKVVDVLTESQPVRHAEHWWLPHLNAIGNENKHERLTPLGAGDSENGWFYNIGDEWYRFPAVKPLARSKRFPEEVDVDRLMTSAINDLPTILAAIDAVK